MPFIHDIGLNDVDCGWEQNWYPKNKNLIVKDNHSMCQFSLCFDSGDVHYLPPADKNALYCLTIPLKMRCKAELLYYEGEPWKVRFTECLAMEVAEEDLRNGRSRMYFQEQSVQQDSSTPGEDCH
jgi:hypothetical protein